MNEIYKALKNDVAFLVHIAVILAITTIIYIIVNRAMNGLLNRHSHKETFDATNYRFIQRALSSVIIIVGFSFIIFLVPSLRHVATTLLAGAGVIVAVIGFASQQVLANILSGIMIVITKPYRLKDRIRLRDIEGIVEDITLRHTVIKNYENKRIVVPNFIMNSEVIVNSNFADDVCCEWVEFGISYTSDIKKARQLMKEEITNHPLFIDHRDKKQKEAGEDIAPVRVINIGDFSITLRAWTWAANPSNAFLLGCDLKESIKERFDKEGIEIPYPYSNVILGNRDENATKI